MAMHSKGLTKLQEECAELTQICAKKSAYIDTDEHPDGAGSMQERMQDEMGDVLAAIEFVSKRFNLDISKIQKRKEYKLEVFEKWDCKDKNYPSSSQEGDMSDLSVTAEIVQKGKRVICRYEWLNPCKKSGAKSNRDFMKEGTRYIAIRGWASGGQTCLSVCEHHADEFFKQITKAKKDLKKINL